MKDMYINALCPVEETPVEETPVASTPVVLEADAAEDDESCCDCTCDGTAPPTPLICSEPLEIKVGTGESAECKQITCTETYQIYMPKADGEDPFCKNCTDGYRPNEDNSMCITDWPCAENSIEYINGTCEPCAEFMLVNDDKSACYIADCPYENMI